jgi:hypothetical protein
MKASVKKDQATGTEETKSLWKAFAITGTLLVVVAAVLGLVYTSSFRGLPLNSASSSHGSEGSKGASSADKSVASDPSKSKNLPGYVKTAIQSASLQHSVSKHGTKRVALIAGLSIGGVLLLIGIGISIWYALRPEAATGDNGSSTSTTPNQVEDPNRKPPIVQDDKNGKNNETSNEKPGLSVGGIVGIVISAIVVFVIVILCCCCRRRQRTHPLFTSKYSDEQTASRFNGHFNRKDNESKKDSQYDLNPNMLDDGLNNSDAPVFNVFKPAPREQDMTHHQPAPPVASKSPIQAGYVMDPSNQKVWNDLQALIRDTKEVSIMLHIDVQVTKLTADFNSFLNIIGKYRVTEGAISEDKQADSDIQLTYSSGTEYKIIYCRRGTPQVEVVRYLAERRVYAKLPVEMIDGSYVSDLINFDLGDPVLLRHVINFFKNLNRPIG